MKFKIYLFALCLSLPSCSVDSSVPDDYEHQGKWVLRSVQNNMVNASKSEHLSYRETYIFQHNGTFVKIRQQENSEEKAQGRYKLVQRPWNGVGEPLLFLDLNFETYSPIIANCTREPVEHLLITSEYILVNSWIACDGLTMEYEKIESTDV